MKTYLVGGAVRDQLLGIPIVERDWVVVGSTVEHMLAMHYQPVGKDFPVFLHPETKEEYALARTERKIGAGYTGFACYAAPDVTLEADLMRRDLTINAMAMDDAGNIIDPYGGQQDIQHRLLRHVSSAFEEDPVRILRLARFGARFAHLGFSIAPETMQLMQHMVKQGCVHDLVPERVWRELERSLQEKSPVLFFQILRACDALKIILPEIEALFGVPNPPKWHPEIDSGWHTYQVLEQAVRLSDSPLVRFAALVHDLGKACTSPMYWPSHHGHDEAGVEQIQRLAARLKIPKNYAQQGMLTARFHSLIHKSRELKSVTLLSLFEKTDAFRRPERFYNILLSCKADARGRTGHEEDPYAQLDYLMSLLAALNTIDMQPLIAQGLTGPAMADAVRVCRLNKILQIEKYRDASIGRNIEEKL